MLRFKFQNIKRTLFEWFNLNIFIIVPLLSFIGYGTLVFSTDYSLINTPSFQNHKVEVFMSITGMLLTAMSIYITLPDTEFRELMSRYGHDRIMGGALFIGTMSSLIGLFFAVTDVLAHTQALLFILSVVETGIVSVWLFKIFKYINN